MTAESQNKLLARRFLEEVVNTGAVDRLSDFLAPEYIAPHVGIAGIDQAREHLLRGRGCAAIGGLNVGERCRRSG